VEPAVCCRVLCAARLRVRVVLAGQRHASGRQPLNVRPFQAGRQLIQPVAMFAVFLAYPTTVMCGHPGRGKSQPLPRSASSFVRAIGNSVPPSGRELQ